MRFLAGAVLAPLFALLAAGPVFAQGLFDDNEARRRVEALRQQMVENQRIADERLSKMETAVAGATDGLRSHRRRRLDAEEPGRCDANGDRARAAGRGADDLC